MISACQTCEKLEMTCFTCQLQKRQLTFKQVEKYVKSQMLKRYHLDIDNKNTSASSSNQSNRLSSNTDNNKLSDVNPTNKVQKHPKIKKMEVKEVIANNDDNVGKERERQREKEEDFKQSFTSMNSLTPQSQITFSEYNQSFEEKKKEQAMKRTKTQQPVQVIDNRFQNNPQPSQNYISPKITPQLPLAPQPIKPPYQVIPQPYSNPSFKKPVGAKNEQLNLDPFIKVSDETFINHKKVQKQYQNYNKQYPTIKSSSSNLSNNTNGFVKIPNYLPQKIGPINYEQVFSTQQVSNSSKIDKCIDEHCFKTAEDKDYGLCRLHYSMAINREASHYSKKI